MRRKKRAVLTGLGIALILTPACGRHAKFVEQPPGPGQYYGQKDQREFRVYIYTDPDNPAKCWADWPVGTLWRTKQQTVLWISDDGLGYTVDFTKGVPGTSPFQNGTTFDVPAGGQKSSGALNSKATGYYSFAIFPAKTGAKPCKDPTDPGYYVQP
jgi:hypothetical protein